MNHAQKMQLKTLIEDYVNAQVAMSWQGAGDPADSAQTRLELIEAENALNDVLYLRTTNDSERLNLLLDTMLAVSNDMKLPPAGQLVMDAMQDHVANGNIITGDDMKGILDVALTTVSIHPTTSKSETVCAEGNIGGDADDTASATTPGNWAPTGERESPRSQVEGRQAQ